MSLKTRLSSAFLKVTEKLNSINARTIVLEDSLTWIYVVTTAQEKGIETIISNGLVSEYLFKGSIIYRFESTAQSSLGYDLEDSFYINFDGTTLINLITKR